MRKKLDLILIFVMIILSFSCQTKKNAEAKLAGAQVLFKQAAISLENRKFVIQANELYPASKQKSVITTSGSYISMNGQKVIVSFTPEVFPGDPWDYLTIKDDASKLIVGKKAKSGDQQYIIKVNGGKEWLRREIVITLYDNTNSCYVQIKDRTGTSIINFKGNVYPKE